MKEILGTWKLLSFYNHDDFGKKNHIMGEKPIGSINYTNTHMSALLAYEGYSQDIIDTINGETYLSYGGRYDGNDKIVYHHVEICSNPNWIGRSLKRNYKIEDNKLTI